MSAHRAPASPLRLTRRGRIVRDMVAGALGLGAAIAAEQISHGFVAAAVWAGGAAGLI